MAEEQTRKFDLPWGTLLPILAALAGVIAQFKPLVSTRPPVPSEKPIPVIAEQDVNARLWQDPIAVAQKENVSGIAHERADDNKICERANRKRADPGGVEPMMFAHKQSGEGEKGATADHLLAGEKERRRCAPRFARINRTGRPDER